MAIRKEETPKMGFPLPAVTYLAENLSGLKVLYSLSCINWELLCFPPIFHFYFPSIFDQNPSFSFFFIVLILSTVDEDVYLI